MSSKIWAALGVGMMAVLGGAALKAKQKVDDKQNGTSPEGRAFASTLNHYLAHSRSVRLPGALTRLDMDPNGDPMPGWGRISETMPVLKDSPLEPVLQKCLDSEDYYRRFPNSIFCGWRVKEEKTPGGAFWRLTQTVYHKLPEETRQWQ